jgi:predicted nuclease with TOPRIM domain
MTETKKNVETVETCDCEALKKELEEVKAELEQVKETNKQYEEAYKDLQIKFNRLYGILGNQIDYSLGIK